MYNALNLSKYIVDKCIKDKQPITNLQLQKILYYIQKAFLKQNKIAFNDAIEAWQFGPAVPESYYHFCGFGAMPITSTDDDIIELAPEDKDVIDEIVKSKRLLPPWVLVGEVQKPNSAWERIYKNGKGNHMVIPEKFIRKYG